MAAIEIKGSEMPEVLINCVNESVATIFETIIGARPEYRGDDEDKMVGDGVVGIISFVGDVTWLMMLALPRKTANYITQRFCGFEVDYDSPDMGDVVGELANVLAGDVVARLGGEGVKVAMSLPTILRGKNVEPLLPRGLPHKKMHFSLPEGELMIKIAGARQGESVGRVPGS